MSKTCLTHNLLCQSPILHGIGVIKRQSILSTMALCLRGAWPFSSCFLGGLIFWLMGVVAVEGKINPPSQQTIQVGNSSTNDQSRHTEANRRDPFKRIPKRTPIPRVLKKSPPEPTPSPGVENPVWRLLGVMHGQDGHRAVIQISPKERVVVQPGSELARSGWIIKSISEGEVLLEHRTLTSSANNSFPPRNFILSFPTLRNSP